MKFADFKNKKEKTEIIQEKLSPAEILEKMKAGKKVKKEVMENLTEALKQDSLKPGDQVHHGYRDHEWRAEFKGYTGHEEPYSEKPKFNTLKDVHAHYGTKNNKELEAHPDGKHVHAVFKEHPSDGGQHYHTYLFHGRWSVGSSADGQKLRRAEPDKKPVTEMAVGAANEARGAAICLLYAACEVIEKYHPEACKKIHEACDELTPGGDIGTNYGRIAEAALKKAIRENEED